MINSRSSRNTVGGKHLSHLLEMCNAFYLLKQTRNKLLNKTNVEIL